LIPVIDGEHERRRRKLPAQSREVNGRNQIGNAETAGKALL
jgi:hypothetical protein